MTNQIPNPNYQFIFLKNLIAGGIFAILALTLLGNYGNLFYPFGKNLIFQAITEILLLFYFTLIFFDRESRPDFKSPIVIAMISLWTINLAAMVFSIDRYNSFFGDPRRMAGFFSWSHLVVFFLLVAGIVKTWELWKKIFYFIIFLSIPTTLWAIWQGLASGTDAVFAGLENSNFFAAYLLFPIFLTLVFLLRAQTKIWKTILIITLLLQSTAFYLAFSRGAFVALFLGLFFFFVFYPRMARIKMVSIGVLAILLLGFSFANWTIIKNSVSDLKTMDRVEIWRTAMLGIKEKPLLGFGQENFLVAFQKYYNGQFDTEKDMGKWTDKAHNFILEAGTTTGIIGILGLLAFWLLVFWKFIQYRAKTADAEKKLLGHGILAMMLAYFTQNLLNVEVLMPQLYSFLFAGFAVFLSQEFLPVQTAFASKEQFPTKLIGAPVLLILAFLTLFSLKNYHLDPLMANFYRNQADKMPVSGNDLAKIDPKRRENLFSSSFANFKKALDHPSFIDPQIRFNYASRISNYVNFPDADREESKKLGTSGIELLEKNFSVRPYYARDLWLAGQLAFLELALADSDKELEFWENKVGDYYGKTLELTPNRPLILTEYAKAEMTARKFSDAQEKLKKAISLNAGLKNPYLLLAVSYKETGQKEKARETLESASKIFPEFSQNQAIQEFLRNL